LQTNYSSWPTNVQVEICLEYPIIIWLHYLIYGDQRGVVWRSCSRLGRGRDRLLVENLILTFGPTRHIDVNASHELVVQSFETGKVSNIAHFNLEVNTGQKVVKLVNIIFLVWRKTHCLQYFDITRMYLQCGLMKGIGHKWQLLLIFRKKQRFLSIDITKLWLYVRELQYVLLEVGAEF